MSAAIAIKTVLVNTYAEPARRQGAKASWRQRLRQLSKKMIRRTVLWLSGAGLAVLFVWMFFGFLARMDS